MLFFQHENNIILTIQYILKNKLNMKYFETYAKVIVKSRRTGEWFPDIYQRDYNGEHYVIGSDHGYNDDEIEENYEYNS